MKILPRKKQVRKEELSELDPKRVSIVKTPANLNGFKHVMFSDANYSVQRVVFDSDVYTKDTAQTYLEEKGFTDFTVNESRESVEGVDVVYLYTQDDVHTFSDVRAVKIPEENVTFYIGLSDSDNEFTLPTASKVVTYSEDPDDDEWDDDEEEFDDWDEEDEEDFDEEELETILFADGIKPTVRMQRAAKKALAWKAEGYKGGTKKSKMRAEKIAMGETLSLKEIRELNTFMEKRISFKDTEGFSSDQPNYPNKQAVTWMMNGGDHGYKFSNRVKKAYQVGKMMKKAKKMSLDFCDDYMENGKYPSFSDAVKTGASWKAFDLGYYHFQSSMMSALVEGDREMVMKNALSFAVFVMGVYDYINGDTYAFSDYAKQYEGEIVPGNKVFSLEDNEIVGKVDKIIYSGNLKKINSEFSLEATESNPVALVEKFELVDNVWELTGSYFETELVKIKKVENFMSEQKQDTENVEVELSADVTQETVEQDSTENTESQTSVVEQLSSLASLVDALTQSVSELKSSVDEKFTQVDVAFKQIDDKVSETIVVKPLQGDRTQESFSNQTQKAEPLSAMEALYKSNK